MNLGINLRELKGFSQEYMANQLNLSQRHYSRFENNETDITISKLIEISKILEVSPQQILGFEEKFIFQNCETALGGINQNYYQFSEKERKIYDDRILHLEGEIIFLRELLNK